MRFSRWLTLALSLCIVAAGVAIVWSFMSRRQQVVTLPETAILSPEISRRSTHFEYTEHKRGRPVFQVDAETSTQTVSNVHTLSEVNLAYFDQVEEPSDSIAGEEATYRIDEKQLEFDGSTRIQLADGTQVISEQAAADLTQEMARINQGFQFSRGDIRGSGGALTYSFAQRVMRVAKGLNLMTSTGGRQIQARAQEGVYRLSDQVVELLQEAGISSGDAELEADQISVVLSEEHHIEKILSAGQAQLQTSPMRAFSGSRIDILFDPESDRLNQIEILGGPSGRAVYSQETGANDTVLEARRIVVTPDSSRVSEHLFLRTFAGLGEVLLRSPDQGITEARATELEGVFYEDGEHLRQLDLRGDVSVLQESHAPDAGETRLLGRILSLRFEPSEILQEARAAGDVELVVRSAGNEKRLVARDFVQVSYQAGIPDRIVSSGDCRVESIAPDGSDHLQAPRVEMRYRQGLLERVVAEAGVRVESLRQGETRYTTSDRLEVIYHEGSIDEVVQAGRFHYWEGEPVTLDLQSDQATFDPVTGRMVATGTQPSVLRTVGGNRGESAVETRAKRFELFRGERQVFAEGEVRSTLDEGDQLTLITAGSMQADQETGWIEYSADPRITQGPNAIHGEIVRYHHQEQRLIVETDVTSSFSEGDRSQDRRYSIESDRLVYNRPGLRARYEGNVRLETQDLVLVSPSIDVAFSDSDSGQIREIIAWGGVRIAQEGRTADGDRAVHYPLESKVVLTGDPAQVIEAERGKVAGRRLTFYVGDEKILVESHSASVTP